MSVFVVAWHMKTAGSTVTYPKNTYFQHTLTVSDFVNFHVLVLAVPTFIFVSTYLYVLKGTSTTSLRKRLRRLSILLTFWPVAWILYKRGYSGLIEIIPHSLSSFLMTVFQAGETIYYFFVCLMVCSSYHPCCCKTQSAYSDIWIHIINCLSVMFAAAQYCFRASCIERILEPFELYSTFPIRRRPGGSASRLHPCAEKISVGDLDPAISSICQV